MLLAKHAPPTYSVGLTEGLSSTAHNCRQVGPGGRAYQHELKVKQKSPVQLIGGKTGRAASPGGWRQAGWAAPPVADVSEAPWQVCLGPENETVTRFSV